MGECIPKEVVISPITPQMRQAGASVYREWREVLDPESLAAEIYSAMVCARSDIDLS